MALINTTEVFFIFSKIVSYSLNPVFWVFSLLILAFIIRKKIWGRRLFFISLVLFYLFSNRFLIDIFLRAWEEPIQNVEHFQQNYELGVVLGGNIVNKDMGSGRLIFRDNVDRIMQASLLYHEGRIDKILLSGGPGHLIYRDKYEAAYLRDYLLGMGVDASDILLDSLSDNTRENAVNSMQIIRDNYGSREPSVLLITSAIHMRRAEACFKKLGIRPDVYGTDNIACPARYDIDYLFVPQLKSFVYWKLFVHEVVGYLVYDIMNFI